MKYKVYFDHTFIFKCVETVQPRVTKILLITKSYSFYSMIHMV